VKLLYDHEALLSDIFLVYNERRDSRSGDMIDRAIVAKMTYLIAF
jgi:hypothetical protein